MYLYRYAHNCWYFGVFVLRELLRSLVCRKESKMMWLLYGEELLEENDGLSERIACQSSSYSLD